MSVEYKSFLTVSKISLFKSWKYRKYFSLVFNDSCDTGHCLVNTLGVFCLTVLLYLQKNTYLSPKKLLHRYFWIFYICQRRNSVKYEKKVISTPAVRSKFWISWTFKNKRLMFFWWLHISVWYILKIFVLHSLKQTLWKVSWIQLLQLFSIYMQMLWLTSSWKCWKK